jgi:hypothetical protein
VSRPPLWPVPAGRAERLALAFAYPFTIPEGSYLFLDGAALPLPEGEDLRGRTPVLAVGSNQSPEQLARKFAHMKRPVRVPVTRCWLQDFDVVHATHITRYGAIPGNLHPAPGVAVRLSVTWLDPEQLAVVHETELTGENYVFGRIEGAKLRLEGGAALDALFAPELFAYVSLEGALSIGGKPLGLAALAAEGRPHPTATVREALAHLHARAGGHPSVEDMVIAAIERPEERRRLTALMRRDALESDWKSLTVLAR